MGQEALDLGLFQIDLPAGQGLLLERSQFRLATVVLGGAADCRGYGQHQRECGSDTSFHPFALYVRYLRFLRSAA
ncbi:hypothetical protein D9M70_566550 [compost metagenome]